MLHRRHFLIALSVFLIGCSKTNTPLPPVSGPSDASKTIVLLLNGLTPSRPSSQLGTYIASFMSQGFSFGQSALRGVNLGIELFFERDAQQEETYRVIQDLGAALEVDIQDMLNRSADRTLALDAYIRGLQTIMGAAQRQQISLDSRLDAASADASEKRKNASTIQREIDKSVRAKDFTTAGSLQPSLNEALATAAAADAQQKEISNMLGVYKDLLRLADQRLLAVQQNRSVLIAGVKVVDVPGIADIGVIEGGRRLRSTGNGGVFGGL